MKRLAIFVSLATFLPLFGQESVFEVSNGLISRSFSYSGGEFTCTSLTLGNEERSFVSGSPDFSFRVNGELWNGNSGWELEEREAYTDETGGEGIRVRLRSTSAAVPLSLDLVYVVYPELPVVRKWIRFHNHGTEAFRLEAVHVEDLQTTLSHVHSQVLHNYARMRHIGRYEGNWDDPVVVVHHAPGRRGMALGNEAPGILKRTAYHTLRDNVEIGLTHPEQDYPFRKWLGPGESWESPGTFIGLYSGEADGYSVVDGPVNDFIRRHMQPRIIRREDKPVFVYNTWNPFRTFVSDSLVREVARAAAECGVKEFIIDDGWQVNSGATTSPESWGNNYGDWNVDTVKFPGGLAPLFAHIRSLGMKPGLWMSIGSATEDAAVYQKHPEWFVINARGEPGNLHSDHDADFHTSCFGTGWVDYIYGVISAMAETYGLAYTKLDFAVAASAYVNDPAISGCYATDHPWHRDHPESYIVIYERLLDLFRRLHEAHPGLFIDCTFETAGKLQLMDYAIAAHADGNWLANFEEASPAGPLRIRQMAWWRSPAVPASSLVIGNTRMDDPGFEYALQSLIGTLPIVLGDPRKIPAEGRERIREWSRWMQEMQDRYDYMSFRNDLPGFGEPSEGRWDGWQRINTDTRQGGVFGVFRHGALEKERRVFLKGLDPDRRYRLHLAPGKEQAEGFTGRALMETGILVEIAEEYGGRVFGVEAL